MCGEDRPPTLTHAHLTPLTTRRQSLGWVLSPCTRASTAHHSLHDDPLRPTARRAVAESTHRHDPHQTTDGRSLPHCSPPITPTTRVTCTRTIMRGGSPCSSSQGVCSWTGGVYVLGFHELWHNGEVAVWRDSTRGGVCWGGPHPLHTLVLPVHLSVSTVHCHGSPSSTAAAVAALHEQPGRIQESRCTLRVSEQRRGGETPALTGTTQRRSTPSRLVSLFIEGHWQCSTGVELVL